MTKIVWTERASNSFEAIVRFIAVEQPYTAEGLLHHITDSLAKLSRFPKLGQRLIAEEQPDSEYRQIIVPPCRVIYLIEKDKISIVNILRTEEMARMVWIVAEQLAMYTHQPSSAATATG